MRINETTNSLFSAVQEPIKRIFNSTNLKILSCFIALAAITYGIYSLIGRIKRPLQPGELPTEPTDLFNRTIRNNDSVDEPELDNPVPGPDLTNFLPDELREHMAFYLKANELANLNHTSHRWNEFIAQSLTSQFLLILEETKAFGQKRYFYNELQVAKILAKFEPKALSEYYSHHDEVLLEIVKVEILSDIEKAKATALQINYGYFRAKAYLEIAKVDPSHSLIEAKASASTIPEYSGRKDEIRLEIVKFECLNNLNEAKVTAELLRNEYKFEAKCEIIKTEALSDIAAAKASVLLIENSYDKDLIYLEIVKIEALSNPEEAKLTTQLIQDKQTKVAGLIEIALAQPPHDFEGAKAAARLIPNEWGRHQAFLKIEKAQVEIVKRLASSNLPEAKILAQKFDDGFMKGLALVEIAKNEPSPNLEEIKALALKTARLSGGMQNGTLLLLEIIKIETLLDVNQAMATAKLVDHPEVERKLTPEIVKIKALSNLDDAKALARSIPSEYTRNLAFLEIVKVEAQKNVIQAKATLQEIKENDQLRFEGLLCLAENALKKISRPVIE
jgi:hypothetical protein